MGYHTAACCEGPELSLELLAAGRGGAVGWVKPLPGPSQHQWGAQGRKQTVCSELWAYGQTTVLEINHLLAPQMSALLMFKRGGGNHRSHVNVFSALLACKLFIEERI